MSIISIETERQVLGDGDAFVKLALPKLKTEQGKLYKNFTAYYSNIYKGFTNYAKNTLAPSAAKRKGAPYGAALNTVLCHENEKVLSLYTDITVSDGAGSRHSRKSILWHKETGTVINPKGLFISGAKKKLCSLLFAGAEAKSINNATTIYSDARRRIKRGFKWENFYVSPTSAVFFYLGGIVNQDIKPFPISFTADEGEGLFSDNAEVLLWGA